MLSSPIMYAWLAWLLVIGVIAVRRGAAQRREEHRRAERRAPRQTGQVAQPASDQMPVIRAPSVTRRRLVPAAHKPQPTQLRASKTGACCAPTSATAESG